jgi:hypothetical protein
MGSIEGVTDKAILVPPVVGPVLFEPARYANRYLDDSHHYVPHPTWRRAMTRPAYDERTLDVALHKGLNTNGDPLEAPMPRYVLGSRARAALTAYLKQLGSASDPGVGPDGIHVAITVAPDADPEDANAVVGVVRAWARIAKGYGKPLILHEWRLTGAVESWMSQLDDAYAQQPVFALLSGVGRTHWEPVQSFCERHHVPCILPSVDVIPRATTHYAVYFSPGVTLEAKILGTYLAAIRPNGSVIQVVGDRAGREAAAELARRLHRAGIDTQTRRFRATAPALSTRGLTDHDVLVLWLRSEELEHLAAVSDDPPAAQDTYLSAFLATPEHVSLPEPWRERVRFVSLDDEVDVQADVARLRLARWLDRHGLSQQADRRLQADAYVACYLFNAALASIKRQEVRRPPVPLTREHVLDELETLVSKRADGTSLLDQDLHIAYYGRMSLGPNQRIATRGGSIVKFASPESRRIVLVSERITPR